MTNPERRGGHLYRERLEHMWRILGIARPVVLVGFKERVNEW